MNQLYIGILLLLLFLVACTPAATPPPIIAPTAAPIVAPTATATATSTPTPMPTSTPTATPTPTPILCASYFEAINPAIIVKHSPSINHYPAAETGGVRSIILTKARNCPESSFASRSLTIFANGQELMSGTEILEQINADGVVRLDFSSNEFPDSTRLQITVRDETGENVFVGEVVNIAQEGTFKVPQFRNVRTGATNPEILDNYEIRVYHVDSIVLPDGTISSSFNIGDILDVDDQCSKPDGIHPEFIHMNAIDYGRCEWGPGSTSYEIIYSGIYPMTVRDVVKTQNGTSVTLDFDSQLVSNPPLFVVENKNETLHRFFLLLQYNHLTEVFVDTGDTVQSGTVIGLIGQFDFRTELEEARLLSEKLNGPIIPYSEGILPFIPFKLTLSETEGDWVESLVNSFNE